MKITLKIFTLSILLSTISLNTFNNITNNSKLTLISSNKTQQDTIYIDNKGIEQATKIQDLSKLNIKQITQIGFYKNKRGEIQAAKMPITIEVVPNELPAVNHIITLYV